MNQTLYNLDVVDTEIFGPMLFKFFVTTATSTKLTQNSDLNKGV